MLAPLSRELARQPCDKHNIQNVRDRKQLQVFEGYTKSEFNGQQFTFFLFI